jgi:hypothetical protein
MEKLAQYKHYVQDVLRQYVEDAPSDEKIEVELSFDTEHDHYHIFNVGWVNKRRIYGCVLHLDIKNGKIWIQHDGTEIGIANELVKLGVPKSDIVLGFHSPYKRQFTEFAVN